MWGRGNIKDILYMCVSGGDRVVKDLNSSYIGKSVNEI